MREHRRRDGHDGGPRLEERLEVDFGDCDPTFYSKGAGDSGGEFTDLADDGVIHEYVGYPSRVITRTRGLDEIALDPE